MNLKRCENNHPTDDRIPVLMGHLVGYCPCGNKYIQKGMIARYVGDIYNELEEKFHKYEFLPPFVCQACGRILGFINIVCVPKPEDVEKDWKEALEQNTMPNGFVKN